MICSGFILIYRSVQNQSLCSVSKGHTDIADTIVSRHYQTKGEHFLIHFGPIFFSFNSRITQKIRYSFS